MPRLSTVGYVRFQFLFQITDGVYGDQLFYGSGSGSGIVIESYSNRVQMNFETDGSDTMQGFQISYAQIGGKEPRFVSLKHNCFTKFI